MPYYNACNGALAVLEMLDQHVTHLQAEHNQRESNTACSSVRTGVYR